MTEALTLMERQSGAVKAARAEAAKATAGWEAGAYTRPLFGST